MERMFKDLRISSDLEDEYSAWVKEVSGDRSPDAPRRVEVSALITSLSCWPTSGISY